MLLVCELYSKKKQDMAIIEVTSTKYNSTDALGNDLDIQGVYCPLSRPFDFNARLVEPKLPERKLSGCLDFLFW